MEFTSWDADLHSSDPNSLEHHGIRGMRWGQRRYQNEDGSLTPLGMSRYGVGQGEGRKRTSVRKMTKDYNRLDQGYANVEAYRQKNVYKTRKYARKANMGSNNKKKLDKLRAKAIKYGKKAALNQKQKEAIEKLQWKIIGTAAAKGYTVNGEMANRTGQTKGQKVLQRLTGVRTGSAVSGQNISIKKYGSGKTSVVNYNAAKSAGVQKIWQDERDKERARQFAGVRR